VGEPDEVDVFDPCPVCAGAGYVHPPPPQYAWLRCHACDGLGRVFKAGGPGYGCTMSLGERSVGEVVELGNGQRVRIAWHQPKAAPETTFVVLVDEWDGTESPVPRGCPSVVGVRSVAVSIPRIDDDGSHAKDADLVDPIARAQDRGRLR